MLLLSSVMFLLPGTLIRTFKFATNTRMRPVSTTRIFNEGSTSSCAELGYPSPMNSHQISETKKATKIDSYAPLVRSPALKPLYLLSQGASDEN